MLPNLFEYWGEPIERTWVMHFKLNKVPYGVEGDFDAERPVYEKIVICMYYMLTTLSTVGYGDFYPFSVAEKIASCLIMVVCGMIFAVLLTSLIDAFSPSVEADTTVKSQKLEKWF